MTKINIWSRSLRGRDDSVSSNGSSFELSETLFRWMPSSIIVAWYMARAIYEVSPPTYGDPMAHGTMPY